MLVAPATEEDPVSHARLSLPVAGLAAAGLLLSACGSSGGSGSGSGAASARASSSAPAASTPAASSPAASAPAASTPPPAAGAGAATADQLKRIVLQPSDLPATFKASPPQPDSGDTTLQAQLATCTGQPGAPESHKVAKAQSDDFQSGDLTVSSSFDSFRSQSDVDAAVAQITSPKINTCLNAAFKNSLAKSLGAGTTVTSATVTLTPGSSGGPSNVVGTAKGAVRFTINGKQNVVHLGVAFVTGPQLAGTLTYVGLNTGLDDTTAGKALALVAQRAQKP